MRESFDWDNVEQENLGRVVQLEGAQKDVEVARRMIREREAILTRSSPDESFIQQAQEEKAAIEKLLRMSGLEETRPARLDMRMD